MTRCQEKRYCMIKSGLAEKYVIVVYGLFVRYMYEASSSEVCERSEGGVLGEGGTAPRIDFETLLVSLQ